MAGTSKNSRGNRPTSASGKQSQFGKILVPLGGGTGAYVLHPSTGTSRRFTVTSEEFSAAVADLVAAGHGARVRDELVGLHDARPAHGWDATLTRLEKAGILS